MRGPAQAPRRLSAPPSPSPSPPGAAASTSALPPSPSQRWETALDWAKKGKHTAIVKILPTPSVAEAAKDKAAEAEAAAKQAAAHKFAAQHGQCRVA